MNEDFIEPGTFADDLDVACDQAEYVDAAGIAPPDAGNYRSRILSWSWVTKSKEDKSLRLDNNRDGVPTYPIMKIEMIELVDGVTKPRKVALYQDFRMKPFERPDFRTGLNKPANNLADILRSADITAAFSNFNEGVELFKSYIAQGMLFAHRGDWVGKDLDFGKAESTKVTDAAIAAGLGGTVEDVKKVQSVKDAINKVWKAATRKGQQNFKLANGSYSATYEGPSGADVEARFEIPYDGFISMSKVEMTKFGSRIKRPEPVAA